MAASANQRAAVISPSFLSRPFPPPLSIQNPRQPTLPPSNTAHRPYQLHPTPQSKLLTALPLLRPPSSALEPLPPFRSPDVILIKVRTYAATSFRLSSPVQPLLPCFRAAREQHTWPRGSERTANKSWQLSDLPASTRCHHLLAKLGSHCLGVSIW